RVEDLAPRAPRAAERGVRPVTRPPPGLSRRSPVPPRLRQPEAPVPSGGAARVVGADAAGARRGVVGRPGRSPRLDPAARNAAARTVGLCGHLLDLAPRAPLLRRPQREPRRLFPRPGRRRPLPAAPGP